MDMQLKTENLHLEQPQGSCCTRAVVEGELTLPGGLREENRLLQTDAMAVVENAEALQDRISVSGRVVFHAVYAQGDPEKIGSVEAAADFTHLCDLPGAVPRSQVFARAHVEQVEGAVNGSRLTLRAVVHIDARALSTLPVEVLTGVSDAAGGEDAVQTRTQQMTLRRTAASGHADALLREEFSLPEALQIRETLYATAYPLLTDASGGLGSIGLSGQVQLEAVHASDLPGKPIVVTRHALPFEQAVTLAGENGEMLDGRAAVKDVAVASQDAGDGERTLRVEVVLGLDAWSDVEETATLLDDAYTLAGDDLRLTSRTLPIRTGDRRFHTAESGKLSLVLPEGSRPVRSVLAAFATPTMTSFEQIGSRMTVDGRMTVTLLYLSDDGVSPVSVRQEAPFRINFAAKPGQGDFLTLTATEAEAVPVTSDRVELRYILNLDGEGLQTQDVRAVTDAQPVAAAEPAGDIVLYFTQPEETLWDIARRYRVPVEGVRALNPELTGDPHTGQGIVVWRRM